MRRKRLIGQTTPLELACTSRRDEFPFNRQSARNTPTQVLGTRVLHWLVPNPGLSTRLPGIKLPDRSTSCRFLHSWRQATEPHVWRIERMRNILRSIGVGALCAVLSGAPMAAFAYTGQELASDARVSIEQARAIAL